MERFQYDQVEVVKLPVNPLFPLMAVYLFFVDGLLVDTGPSIQRRRLIPVFQSLAIEHVAVTHHHEDHSGMASWLARHFEADIYVNRKGMGIAEKPARIPWYRSLFSGRRLAFQAKPYPKVIETSNLRFYPIHTPGHTSDHICLYEPDKGWLFSGDLYITPYPKVFLKNESIAGYIQTLRELKSLDYDTVFCGHEGVISNGKNMMNEKLVYLENTRDEVFRLHRAGFDDRTIMKKMFPKQVKLEQLSFGTFSRLHLIRSCYREPEEV
ncbi:MAG TPA: MBL fold metallo-hydrolase [Bacillales bacterium]|nr:MBL fold metallo-hydrolase [Bacillales bacterium]